MEQAIHGSIPGMSSTVSLGKILNPRSPPEHPLECECVDVRLGSLRHSWGRGKKKVWVNEAWSKKAL